MQRSSYLATQRRLLFKTLGPNRNTRSTETLIPTRVATETEGRTEPAIPQLPPPMKTISYFSWPGLVVGGMFATWLPVENAHVICETLVSLGVQGAVENVEDRRGSGGGMLW